MGKPPSLKHLRIFGCRAYAHQNKGKLEPRSVISLFMGYPTGTKGFRLVHKDDNSYRFFISRNVIFREDQFPGFLETKKSDSSSVVAPVSINQFQIEPLLETNTELPENSQPSSESENLDTGPIETPELGIDQAEPNQVLEDQIGDLNESEQDEILEDSNLDNYLLSRDRTRRTIRVPSRFLDANLVIYALNVSVADNYVPENFQDAISCSDSSKWQRAMNEELESLKKNKTWILVNKPENKKLVSCKWVYRIKESLPLNDPNKFKARLVAKGFT